MSQKHEEMLQALRRLENEYCSASVRNDVMAKVMARIEELREAVVLEIERLAPVNMGSGLTDAELVIACRNIGFDLTCGACAGRFYTGAMLGEHTCPSRKLESREQANGAELRDALKTAKVANSPTFHRMPHMRLMEAIAAFLLDSTVDGHFMKTPSVEELVAKQRLVDEDTRAMADQIVENAHLASFDDAKRYASTWIATAAQSGRDAEYWRKRAETTEKSMLSSPSSVANQDEVEAECRAIAEKMVREANLTSLDQAKRFAASWITQMELGNRNADYREAKAREDGTKDLEHWKIRAHDAENALRAMRR